MKELINKITKVLGFRIVLRSVYSNKLSNDYQLLQERFQSYKPLKLHFGCGPRILKGWVNIDLKYVPYKEGLNYYPDDFYGPLDRGDRNDFYAVDATKHKLPLPGDSVDLIFHEDFIEHLSQRDQWVFLAETFRVLKKGGIHRINTPDLLTSLSNNSIFSKGGVGVYTNEWDEYDHVSVMTKSMLKEMAEKIGYTNLVFSQRDMSLSKEIPKEYRPGNDRDSVTGNIFADLVK